jgi:hypothetical protein
VRPACGFVYALLIVVALGACSQRQAYEGLRYGAKQNCLRQPTEDAYQRCLERQRLDYPAYRQARAQSGSG